MKNFQVKYLVIDRKIYQEHLLDNFIGNLFNDYY